MNTNHLLTSAILAVGFVAGGFTGAVLAEVKTGTATVTISSIKAVEQTGVADPKMDSACQLKYKNYLNEKVVTEYSIDKSKGIQSAQSTFMATPAPLFPMGLTGSYSFMSDKLPQALTDLGVIRIIFALNLKFANPTSSIMLPLGTGTDNCILSSAKKPFEGEKHNGFKVTP